MERAAPFRDPSVSRGVPRAAPRQSPSQTCNGVTGRFHAPVEPPAVATNNAKAGQMVPLKFYAETASGPITDLVAAILSITGVACTDVLNGGRCDRGIPGGREPGAGEPGRWLLPVQLEDQEGRCWHMQDGHAVSAANVFDTDQPDRDVQILLIVKRRSADNPLNAAGTPAHAPGFLSLASRRQMKGLACAGPLDDWLRHLDSNQGPAD